MMELQSCFQVSATLVANEFIDQYMAAASGEYVKVYLYLLRHQNEPVELEHVADALNHTEADVRRALAYWEKLGVLRTSSGGTGTAATAGSQTVNGPVNDEPPARKPPVRIHEQPAGVPAQADGKVPAAPAPAPAPKKERKPYSQEQVNQLAGNEDFSQLLYIAQKYLNKIFTQRECEVFAYLYDGLQMSIEVLEYLVEYCVQGGHNSIRYIEAVALSWHERGFDTVEKAKAHTSGFMKDSFAVMKAFGLSNRRPGNAELEIIEKWFKEYGFTKELVVEACSRTLITINNPSFQYADKILSEWKKAGVKNLKDVDQLAQKRSKTDRIHTRRKAESASNRFHNFEQRDTDYNALVLEQVNSWMGDE